MKKILLVLAVAGLTLPVMADLKSDLIATNKAVCKAIMKKDMGAFKAAIQGHVTKDFKHVENGQSMNFQQMMDTMKSSFAMIEKMENVDSTLLSLKIAGDKATARNKHTMVGTMKGPDGKSHKMSYEGISTDTLVKQGGKWLMSRMEWSNMKMMMDGKPFDPSKMASPPGKGGN